MKAILGRVKAAAALCGVSLECAGIHRQWAVAVNGASQPRVRLVAGGDVSPFRAVHDKDAALETHRPALAPNRPTRCVRKYESRADMVCFEPAVDGIQSPAAAIGDPAAEEGAIVPKADAAEVQDATVVQDAAAVGIETRVDLIDLRKTADAAAYREAGHAEGDVRADIENPIRSVG